MRTLANRLQEDVLSGGRDPELATDRLRQPRQTAPWS